MVGKHDVITDHFWMITGKRVAKSGVIYKKKKQICLTNLLFNMSVSQRLFEHIRRLHYRHRFNVARILCHDFIFIRNFF
jgi:hypothetical protein